MSRCLYNSDFATFIDTDSASISSSSHKSKGRYGDLRSIW